MQINRRWRKRGMNMIKGRWHLRFWFPQMEKQSEEVIFFVSSVPCTLLWYSIQIEFCRLSLGFELLWILDSKYLSQRGKVWGKVYHDTPIIVYNFCNRLAANTGHAICISGVEMPNLAVYSLSWELVSWSQRRRIKECPKIRMRALPQWKVQQKG